MNFVKLILLFFLANISVIAQQTTVTSSGPITEITNIAYKKASSQIGSVLLTSTGKITIYFNNTMYFDGSVSDLIIAGATTPQQKYDYFKARLSAGIGSSTSATSQSPMVIDSTSERLSHRVVNFPDSTKSRKTVQISNFPDSLKSRKVVQIENFPDSAKSRKQIEVLNFPDSTQSRKLVQISNFPELPVFGNIPPEGSDYTGFSAISVENMLLIIVENMGPTNGIFTFAGLQYQIQTGEQRRFEAIFDKTKSKYTPIGPLTVDGSGTTIRVIKIPSQ
jgi:hypothetical protein